MAKKTRQKKQITPQRLMELSFAYAPPLIGNIHFAIDAEAKRHLAKISDGDPRKCLSVLEIGVLTTSPDMEA